MDSKQFQKLLLPKLREAMLYTRSRIPMKSANKFYPDKRMIDGLMMTNPDKYRMHSLGGDRNRSLNLAANRKLKLAPQQVYRKYEQDHRNGIRNAGNCGENAMIAFWYLTEHIRELEKLVKTPIKILTIFLKHPVDHSLVLVGTEPPRGSGKIMENTLICDPWGKIVCPLAHYSLEWKMKMNKWSNRGLKGKCGRGTYDPFYDQCSRESVSVGRLLISEQTYSGKTQRIKDTKTYSLINKNEFS